MNAGFQWFVPDLAASNLGMSDTLEYKRAATQAVHSLGLQSDLRARAVVLVAADNQVGNDLRTLIQLNEDDPGLKALVEEFLTGGVSGNPHHAQKCQNHCRYEGTCGRMT